MTGQAERALRLDRPRPERISVPAPMALGGRPARVLVVDDHPAIRHIFRVTLETAGYRVVEARDGLEALGLLEGGGFRAITLDLRLPGLDGEGVLTRLREATRELAVVVVSGTAREAQVAHALALGAADVLCKPVTPEILRASVASAIERRSHGESLASARVALSEGDRLEAERILLRVVEDASQAAEAYTLLGIVHAEIGEHHAAYWSYRAALASDDHYWPALRLLAAYCQRFGLDPASRQLNPASETLGHRGQSR